MPPPAWLAAARSRLARRRKPAATVKGSAAALLIPIRAVAAGAVLDPAGPGDPIHASGLYATGVYGATP